MGSRCLIYHCKYCKNEHRETSAHCPKCAAFMRNGGWLEGRAPNVGSVLTLSEIRELDVAKLSITAELDEALDGGVVPGGVYLMGGEPGIGKSTLCLQMLGRLSEQRVLYISAEEAA